MGILALCGALIFSFVSSKALLSLALYLKSALICGQGLLPMLAAFNEMYRTCVKINFCDLTVGFSSTTPDLLFVGYISDQCHICYDKVACFRRSGSKRQYFDKHCYSCFERRFYSSYKLSRL